jgi:CheY-like chemotaxis protein
VDKPHILVIDDDAMTRCAFRRMLSNLFSFEAVACAERALARIDAGERFDAIVCDLNLVGTSGQDFYERMLARAPDQAARVVIVTGTEPAEDDAFAAALGDRYVLKSACLVDLVSKLQMLAARVRGVDRRRSRG